MSDIELLVDLHKNSNRQGPGSDAITLKAFELTGLSKNQHLNIADIGCGSGAQTICLAQNTNSHITAIDIFPEFLERLHKKAKDYSIDSRITTIAESMDNLSFADQTFDLIWSEGAIYIMGFEKGIKQWRSFLKDNAILAVSEISWFTDQRPKELEDYWLEAYPEIDTASNKIKLLEENGYSPLAYFKLPVECWIKEYYQPLQEMLTDFLRRHNNSPHAQAIAENEKQEMKFYNMYNRCYGYGFYIAQKV